MSRCYGQITMVDEAGGLILDKLEELGLAHDTLVIWTTDHGDALASHGGHFDKDAYMEEETLRIPFAMRCDGIVPSGVVSDALISNVDLAPTMLDAAGTAFSAPVDGKSIFSLFSQPETAWRQQVYAETFGHHIPHRAQMLADKRYKYVRNKNQIEELYDLLADPYEMHNLALRGEYKDLLSQKRAQMDAFTKENHI